MIKQVLIAVYMSTILNTLTPTEEVSQVVTYSMQHFVNGEEVSYTTVAEDIYGNFHSIIMDKDGYVNTYSVDGSNWQVTNETEWTEVQDVYDSSGTILEYCKELTELTLDCTGGRICVFDSFDYTCCIDDDIRFLPDLGYEITPDKYSIKFFRFEDKIRVILRVWSGDEHEVFILECERRPENEVAIQLPYIIGGNL